MAKLGFDSIIAKSFNNMASVEQTGECYKEYNYLMFLINDSSVVLATSSNKVMSIIVH